MKKISLLLLILFVSAVYSQNYIVETPLLNLHRPVAFEFLSPTKVIVTHKEHSARIYDLATGTQLSTFWTFTDSLQFGFERGVLGVTKDPNYAVNKYIYIYYVHLNPQSLRVVRFTETNNLGTNPLIIFNSVVGTIAGNHVGGNIRFGPDGMLYISIGELAVTSNAQTLTNPWGKILRINSDGTIPNTNPYYDDGNPSTGNDDRIWAWGCRNSFDLTFSPVNDSLYTSENGASSFDEVNFIRKGKNYGWPVCQGYCIPYNPLYQQPMHVWPSPLPAVTGIMVYEGAQMPWLNGKMLVADNNYGRIYLCELGKAPAYDTVISRTQMFDLDALTTIMQGPDGFIYALNGGYTSTGKIYRIKPDNVGINNNNEPVSFELYQNYPNPFNPNTIIKFEVNSTSTTLSNREVRLVVYNSLGQEIKTLVNERLQAGTHEVEFDGSNLPSGVYYYRLTVDGASIEKKMVMMK
jgi:glucose/arabinose dehydrogenase